MLAGEGAGGDEPRLAPVVRVDPVPAGDGSVAVAGDGELRCSGDPVERSSGSADLRTLSAAIRPGITALLVPESSRCRHRDASVPGAERSVAANFDKLREEFGASDGRLDAIAASGDGAEFKEAYDREFKAVEDTGLLAGLASPGLQRPAR
jgi:hypothetical protein